jgi:hypothetical protein
VPKKRSVPVNFGETNPLPDIRKSYPMSEQPANPMQNPRRQFLKT